jgi:hypothetical protein
MYMGLMKLGMLQQEPIVPEPSAIDVEIAVEKVIRHKSLGSDQIPTALIKAGGRAIRSQIHRLINSV